MWYHCDGRIITRGVRGYVPTQGVYDGLLLVPIVGRAYFLSHQLMAVFNSSSSIFQMTLKISHINKMGREGDFCDIVPMYALKCHENGSFVEGEDNVALRNL